MTLYVLAGLMVALSGVIIALYVAARNSGKTAQQASDLKVIDATQDKQLEAANEPRDPGSIADKLHDHKF